MIPGFAILRLCANRGGDLPLVVKNLYIINEILKKRGGQ